MNIEIVKLSPQHLDDYLYFFENIAHADNPEWGPCYCLNFCSDTNADLVSRADAQTRRKLAIQYINSSKIQGYLAYHNEKIVGWCNANDRTDCLHSDGWRLITDNYTSCMPEKPGEKVKFIYCFTVAPEMRRKGIAKALLQRICEDAAKEGYDCIEACPNKEFSNIYYDYVGPMRLYETFGFTPYGETKSRIVMRKYLNCK